MSKGIRDALVAAVLFGISAPVVKLLIGHLPPQLLAGLLYLGSACGLAFLKVFRRSSRAPEVPLSSSKTPVLAVAILFGGVLAPLLLMLGLQRTPASGAALLLNLEAVFTAAIAWMVFRENLSRRVVLGWLAILAGGVVLTWTDSVAASQYGMLAIVGACFCWGIDNNLTQKISASDPVSIAILKGLVAGAINTVIALRLNENGFDVPLGLAAMSIGFVSYGLSLVLYIRALRLLGTARAGNYFSVAPFVGAAAGIVLWQETPTVRFVIAGLLMAVGIWTHVTEHHSHWHVHEPLVHEHPHTHDEHHQHVHSTDDPPGEPHTHPHRHERLEHSHPHYPDIHHRHPH